MPAMEVGPRQLLARYARLAALCRLKADSSPNATVAKELGELADAYDRRRTHSI